VSTGPCVFVVDDDGSVRDALQVLVQSAGLSFRGFASAEEFLEHYHPGQPGCLITDVCLPGTDGLCLQQILKERGIAIPIIVISGHGDIPMSVRMIREGALDFLEKPFRNHHMLQRVREALEEDARRRAEARAKAAVLERYRSLTPREREIAHLLMEGVPNKVIAAQLDLSTRTVEGHRATILRKMEVRSTATLTQHLMRLPEVAAADGDPLATA
jgi:two-component system response regulator FixJ